MTDKALVERLREEADEWDEPKSHDEFDMRGLLHSAADRIEALSAENERLLDIDEVKANVIDSLLNDLASAEQENERLRERIERLRKALYAAYDDEPGWCDLTRAALGETE